MVGKKIREKGKVRLSEYFKNLKKGEKVCIVREASQKASFPKRIIGNTGIIESARGKAYIVKLNDYNQEKRYIIQAIHLKRITGKKK